MAWLNPKGETLKQQDAGSQNADVRVQRMLPPGLSHRFQIRLPDVQVTALRVQIVALAGGTEDSRFFVQGSGSGYGDVGFRVSSSGF